MIHRPGKQKRDKKRIQVRTSKEFIGTAERRATSNASSKPSNKVQLAERIGKGEKQQYVCFLFYRRFVCRSRFECQCCSRCNRLSQSLLSSSTRSPSYRISSTGVCRRGAKYVRLENALLFSILHCSQRSRYEIVSAAVAYHPTAACQLGLSQVLTYSLISVRVFSFSFRFQTPSRVSPVFRIADKWDENKMTIQNLSVIFGPTLMTTEGMEVRGHARA